MSNRTLVILLGFAKSMKQDISISMDNDAIAKAVAFNMALEEVVTFLSNLIDNKISPDSLEHYARAGSEK